MNSFRNLVEPLFTHETLRMIMAKYDMLVHDEPFEILGGWTNFTVSFTANNEPYILRFYRNRQITQQDILESITIIDHLRAANIPVPVILRDTQGNALQTITLADRDFHIVVFSHLPGDWVNHLNHQQTLAVGELIGVLHNTLANHTTVSLRTAYDYQRDVDRTTERYLSFFSIPGWKFRGIAAKKEMQQTFEDDFTFFDEFFPSYHGLLTPNMIVHGDIHQSNLKFKKNTISGLFDFDTLMKAPKLLELAITIVRIRIKQPHNTHAPKPEEIFPLVINGYDKYYKLSPEEMDALHGLCRFMLWKEALWLYEKAHDPRFRWYQRHMFGSFWYGVHQLAKEHSKFR